MKNVIYLVVAEYCCDFDISSDYFAFSNLDSAKEKFNSLKQPASEDAEEAGLTIKEDHLTFSAYEDGSYAENHTDITVCPIELN